MSCFNSAGFLDLATRLLEDDTEHTGLEPELFEAGAVLVFQR